MGSKPLEDYTDDDLEQSKEYLPPYFSANAIVSAKVVRIYDGHTCDLVFTKDTKKQRYQCRLSAINAPELSTGRQAKKARDFLLWLCLCEDPARFPHQHQPYPESTIQSYLNKNKHLVSVKFGNIDCYGRPLVILANSIGRTTLNNQLIDYGYAKIYLKDLEVITVYDVARSDGPPPTYVSTKAKVVSIHDGDTCDLVYINGRFQRFECRLSAIKAPELSTGTHAKKARDFLLWLCQGKDPANFPGQDTPLDEIIIQSRLNDSKHLIFAQFKNIDYYGRPLVILSNSEGGPTFNDQLIQYRYAKVYS